MFEVFVAFVLRGIAFALAAFSCALHHSGQGSQFGNLMCSVLPVICGVCLFSSDSWILTLGLYSCSWKRSGPSSSALGKSSPSGNLSSSSNVEP